MEYKTSKEIKDQDLRKLYTSLHWSAYTDKFPDLSVLLRDCMIVYSAWDKDKLVGLIRVIGDNVSIAYVQDLLVLPEYQKTGVGKELLDYVLENTRHIRQFQLITDNLPENQSIRDWYQSRGLIPNTQAGLTGFGLDRG